MSAARAPYGRGPRRRAATMVKPYVATLMIPIATAMELLVLNHAGTLNVAFTTPGVCHRPGNGRRWAGAVVGDVTLRRSPSLSDVEDQAPEGGPPVSTGGTRA